MAKQKVGVYDRVLECAKEEFLSRGFLDASLRTIAQEAETSTGSIYTRFGDKEGLFRALAEPVVDEFKAMFRKVQEDFHQFPEEEQRPRWASTLPAIRKTCWTTSTTTLMYSACCWTGPWYPVFALPGRLVDIEVEYTYKYMEVIGCESVKSGLVTEEFIHIIVTATSTACSRWCGTTWTAPPPTAMSRCSTATTWQVSAPCLTLSPDKRGPCPWVQPSCLHKS